MSSLVRLYIPLYTITFFYVAIFLKSYLQYKRTGVNPVTFGNKSESAHDYIGGWFKLVLVGIFIYCASVYFINYDKISFLDTSSVQIIGIIITIASLIVIVAAQNTMADSWRIGIDEKVKTELVTKGLFAYVRNPIFSGMIATVFGLFLLIPTIVMGFLVIISMMLIGIQVRLEEEFLARVHGRAYIEYKKNVGRFLPKIIGK